MTVKKVLFILFILASFCSLSQQLESSDFRYEPGITIDIEINDLDGDLDNDVVFISAPNKLVYMENQGTNNYVFSHIQGGRFNPHYTTSEKLNKNLISIDINNDGYNDLAYLSYNNTDTIIQAQDTILDTIDCTITPAMLLNVHLNTQSGILSTSFNNQPDYTKAFVINYSAYKYFQLQAGNFYSSSIKPELILNTYDRIVLLEFDNGFKDSVLLDQSSISFTYSIQKIDNNGEDELVMISDSIKKYSLNNNTILSIDSITHTAVCHFNDVDDDGDIDYIYKTGNKLLLATNNGSWVYSRDTVKVSGNVRDVLIEDVNLDGVNDVVYVTLDKLLAIKNDGQNSFLENDSISVIQNGGINNPRKLAVLKNQSKTDFLLGVSQGVHIYQSTFTTHINQLGNDEGISLFPNPSTDKISLILQKNEILVGYQIINIKGQILDVNHTQEVEIEIDKLKKGIYHLNVVTNKNSYLMKFIKQ